METVTLNNGVVMPLVGYGTYQTPSRMTERCVEQALAEGYRSVDTAQCYGNEHEVGLACRKSGIPRDKIFVTTKLWGCRAYDDALISIDRSLRTMDMDYIDLLLIHEPTGHIHEIYRAMETAYRDGKIRAIGISNFMEEKYDDLVRHSEIIPAVNQVETHVFRQQKRLRTLEEKMGTTPESWSPLACGENGIWRNPVLKDIAGVHKKSVSQVALRFLTQQGIIVIPKSTNPEHMRENLAIMDFALEPHEMETIRRLDTGRSLFNWW